MIAAPSQMFPWTISTIAQPMATAPKTTQIHSGRDPGGIGRRSQPKNRTAANHRGEAVAFLPRDRGRLSPWGRRRLAESEATAHDPRAL